MIRTSIGPVERASAERPIAEPGRVVGGDRAFADLGRHPRPGPGRRASPRWCCGSGRGRGVADGGTSSSPVGTTATVGLGDGQDLGPAGRGDQAEPGRRRAGVPGLEQDLARPHLPAPGQAVQARRRPGRRGSRSSRRVRDRSTITTASAPGGRGAPVMIRAASPRPSGRVGHPAGEDLLDDPEPVLARGRRGRPTGRRSRPSGPCRRGAGRCRRRSSSARVQPEGVDRARIGRAGRGRAWRRMASIAWSTLSMGGRLSARRSS